MAGMYEVQYLLDVFSKKAKIWRLEENFRGIVNADIVGIFKNFVFWWLEFKLNNKQATFRGFNWKWFFFETTFWNCNDGQVNLAKSRLAF